MSNQDPRPSDTKLESEKIICERCEAEAIPEETVCEKCREESDNEILASFKGWSERKAENGYKGETK